jgi:cytosine/creatinine deaminase
MDILIRDAKLQTGETVCIGIEDGYITAIQPELVESAKLELQAEGKLVIPAFVNGHLHACKSFWREGLTKLEPNFDFTDSAARFAAIAKVKQHYTPQEVAARAERSIRLALRHGTCAIRTFADVDSDAGLRALEGLLNLREQYRQIMNVQVVAFPQNGVFRARASTENLLHRALELDIDAIGGIPWLEPSEESQKAHVDLILGLAKSRNLDAHFVLDDTDDPTARSAEYVAARTIELGMQTRVHGTQANALAYYDDAHAARVIRLIQEAGMTIFSNPHVALVTTNLRHQPAPRGMTRVKELLAAGVPIATAQDDIDNPYYPFGRNDLLEVAQYMAHLGQFAWGDEINRVLEMVTQVPANVMKLEHYGLSLESKANLVILEAANWRDALQFQAEKLFVIVNGKLVSRASRQQEFLIYSTLHNV